MSFQDWTAFAVAAAIVLVIPGPTIIFVVGQAAAFGREAVPALVLGVFLGDLTAMSLSLLGLGAIILASATLFTILKWVGAGYLLYLGVKLWRDKTLPMTGQGRFTFRSRLSICRRAFLVTALNPKSIVFFIAFLPQFIQPSENFHGQLLLTGCTFLSLAVINCALYGFFAGCIRRRLQSTSAGSRLNRAGGSVLIGAGLMTITAGPSG